MPASILRLGLPLVASGAMFAACKKTLLNDSTKRDFYADNTDDIVPGKPQEADSQLAKLMAERANKPDSELQKQAKKARLFADKQIDTVHQWYVKTSSSFFREERKVTDLLSSLHDKREPLWPDALYIATGFLAGSVVCRKSNILLRATVPLAFGIATFKFFMPSTASNTAALITGYERQNFPAVYDKQQELKQGAKDFYKKSEETRKEGEAKASEYYEKTRKKLGELTGLKVDEPVTNKKQ